MIVSTINILRSLRDTSGSSVIVQGKSKPDDGYGGEFYWDSLSIEKDDDQNIIQTNSISIGRWKRIIGIAELNAAASAADALTYKNSAFTSAANAANSATEAKLAKGIIPVFVNTTADLFSQSTGSDQKLIICKSDVEYSTDATLNFWDGFNSLFVLVAQKRN